MDSCCHKKSEDLQALPQRQKRILWVVLVINLIMFFVESYASWISHSIALLADSLDMAGDAFVYGISLYAIGRSPRWNASVSLIKGGIMGVLGVGVLLQAFLRFRAGEIPTASLMGEIGTVALVANFTCAVLLLRHRSDDLNMRSIWLCSRNDVIANLGVLIAAAGVSHTGSLWPDLLVGVIIATLVLHSSFLVLRESLAIL